MMDLQNRAYCPSLEEVSAYIRNPLFDSFCVELSGVGAKSACSFSSCSMMPGWNVKFRKGGKALCTLYPREGFFTVLLVIGQKEKAAAEAMLLDCADDLRELYAQTREGNGQRWLMIDLEDNDQLYRDTLELMKLRIPSKTEKM